MNDFDKENNNETTEVLFVNSPTVLTWTVLIEDDVNTNHTLSVLHVKGSNPKEMSSRYGLVIFSHETHYRTSNIVFNSRHNFERGRDMPSLEDSVSYVSKMILNIFDNVTIEEINS